MIVWMTAWLVACTPSPPVCPTEQGTLTDADDAVSCADARGVIPWIQAMSGRVLTPPQRERVLRALASHPPSEVRAALARVGTLMEALGDQVGLDQAEQRSKAVHAATAGGGPMPRDDFPTVMSVFDAAVAVWERDEASGLVLTEMDVEGWIRYASLVREVQGGTPLNVSLADRVGMYRVVRERWKKAEPEGKVALASFGIHWPIVASAWKRASYDDQQAWIKAAPLPPPMTGTSAEFLEAVSRGDVARHARILQRTLGPFQLQP